MTNEQPILTIAICTYNRSAMLEKVCNALFRQTVPIDQFCVLIVDNASTDGTKKYIEVIKKLFPHFYYIFEPIPGLSHARNAAWKNCHTPWIAYIDDDSKPEPRFVEALLKAIEGDNCDVIAGSIKPWCLYPLPSWFLSEYEEYIPSSQYGALLSPSDFAYGGNIAIRRNWFEVVGGFNPDFGILGKVAPLGEETEFQRRIRAKGGRICFAPDAVVAHCAVPSKYTIAAQLRIRYRSGKSTQILFDWRGWRELGRLILKIPYRLGHAISTSVHRFAKGTYRWQNALIAVGGEACFLAGLFSGWLWLQQHKDWHL